MSLPSFLSITGSAQKTVRGTGLSRIFLFPTTRSVPEFVTGAAVTSSGRRSNRVTPTSDEFTAHFKDLIPAIRYVRRYYRAEIGGPGVINSYGRKVLSSRRRGARPAPLLPRYCSAPRTTPDPGSRACRPRTNICNNNARGVGGA